MKYLPLLSLIAISSPALLHAQSAEIAESAGADAFYPEQFCEQAHIYGPHLAIEPFLNAQLTIGHTDLEHSGLDTGAHDPRHTGISVTGISLGADILYSEHLAAYAEGILSWNDHDGWDSELEEAYAKFMNLPGDIDIKAGRMLALYGTQNNIHNHAWHFVDASLANTRFLGEDGLITDGVELQWILPTSWNNRLIVSYGHPVEHDHDHDNHGHDEHHDDDEHEEEEHHEEGAEMALWDDPVLSARYEASFWPSDNNHLLCGASYAQGKNQHNQWSRLYGLDLTYTWIEDEINGHNLVWRNELMWRDVDTDEDGFDELGFNSSAIWSPNLDWDISLRYDYLEGADEVELAERHRVSPALTRHFTLGKVNAHSRLQYNYDHSDERDSDHSIWLQFAIEWGAGHNH